MLINYLKKKISVNLKLIFQEKNKKTLKGDGSIVTKSDILIQNIINKKLKKKIKKNFYLISEEKKFNKFNNYNNYKYIITLDPIDGTENFYYGLPEWGISISIYKKMKHYQSCLFLPSINSTLKTGDKIIRNLSKIKSYSSTITLKKIDKKKEFRFFGSCVYSIYNVIVGSVNSYKSEKANSWDILAGANLGIEHGLSVKVDNKKYYGEFLQPGKKYKFEIKN